jgi:hypothetical protein
MLLGFKGHQFTAQPGLLDLGTNDVLEGREAAAVACLCDPFEAPHQVEYFARQALVPMDVIPLRVDRLDPGRDVRPGAQGAAPGAFPFEFGHFALEVALAKPWMSCDNR